MFVDFNAREFVMLLMSGNLASIIGYLLVAIFPLVLDCIFKTFRTFKKKFKLGGHDKHERLILVREYQAKKRRKLPDFADIRVTSIPCLFAKICKLVTRKIREGDVEFRDQFVFHAIDEEGDIMLPLPIHEECYCDGIRIFLPNNRVTVEISCKFEDEKDNPLNVYTMRLYAHVPRRTNRGSKDTDGFGNVQEFCEASTIIEVFESLCVEGNELRVFIMNSGDEKITKSNGEQKLCHIPPLYDVKMEKSGKTFGNTPCTQKHAFYRTLRNFQENKGFFRQHGMKTSLFTVLYGPPGTGKTSLCHAAANDFKKHIVYLNPNKILTEEGLLRAFLSENRQGCHVRHDQTLIVVDDVDASALGRLMLRRELGIQPGNTNITLQSLLSLIDGVHTPDGLIVVFCTNIDPYDAWDPAIMRPGRLDSPFHITRLSKDSVIDAFTSWFRVSPSQDVMDRISDNAFTQAELGELLRTFDVCHVEKRLAETPPAPEEANAPLKLTDSPAFRAQKTTSDPSGPHTPTRDDSMTTKGQNSNTDGSVPGDDNDSMDT